jgi:hypothetical protein
MVPFVGHGRFLPNPFQFISHPTFVRYIVLTLTASLNNIKQIFFHYSTLCKSDQLKRPSNKSTKRRNWMRLYFLFNTAVTKLN